MSDSQTPKVRASFARAFVDAVEGLPQGADILERLEPARLARARAMDGSAWVSFRDHAEVLRAVWEGSGEVGFKTGYRRFVQEAVEQRLLQQEFAATVRSFGRDPAMFLRLLPRAVASATRHVTRPVVYWEGLLPCEARIEWHDLCRDAEQVVWPTLLEAACLAVLDLCHASLDDLNTDASRLLEGRVDITLRWQPRRPTPVPGW